MINSLAVLMHEKWRSGRIDPETSSYIPRIKAVKDTDWISKHDGVSEVDIANTPFNELPADWKEENLLSAKVALEKIEDALYLIHDNWIDRNDQSASADQKVQYSRLSKEEKEKDIQVLREAVEILSDFAD